MKFETMKKKLFRRYFFVLLFIDRVNYNIKIFYVFIICVRTFIMFVRKIFYKHGARYFIIKKIYILFRIIVKNRSKINDKFRKTHKI